MFSFRKMDVTEPPWMPRVGESGLPSQARSQIDLGQVAFGDLVRIM